MSSRTVTSQAELDQALADKTDTIYIQSPEGVWITLRDSDSSHVVAWDSSHVVAWDSSHVEARDSSHVVAWGSSHVVAWDSSHVEARDSSHVEAKPLVAVHLHSARAQVDGGVVIDIASLDQTDPQTWCDIQGIDVTDGHAVVYKAVDDNLKSGRGLAYPIGETVKVLAKEWKADGACGNGLHFGPTPRHARSYFAEATRFLACRIPLSHASGIPGGTAKVKARSCEVLYEVGIDGERLTVTEQVAS